MNVHTLVEELKEQLQLEDRALQDALTGLPSQDATGLTPAEKEAVDSARAAAQKEISDAVQCRAETDEALKDCRTTLQEVKRARQGLERETPPARPDVMSLTEARDRTKAHYTAFKVQHKLQRDATGDDRVVQGCWAGVVVVVESMFNAYFYAPISDLGLLGGLFTALFVSVINVAFAFIGGVLGLRFLSHVDPTKKLGGLIAFSACLLVCALVVTMSALFRGHADAMSTNTLDTGMLVTAAWQASVDSLLALDVIGLLASLHSFLLALVGAICAIIGFWKGRDFDDPYPGFGAAYRQKENAQAELDDASEEGEQRQRQWQRQHSQELLRLSHKLDHSKSRMSAACSGLRQKIESNWHLAEDAASLAETLLGVYRQKNKQIRADDPPGYFDDYKTDYADLKHDLGNVGKHLSTLERDIQHLGDECDGQLAEIQAAIVGTPDGSTQ